jgi:hypothetical protein
VSGIWNDTKQEAALSGTPAGEVRLKGPQVEGQTVYRTSRLTLIGGAGAFDGTFDAGGGDTGDERFGNLYGYVKIRGLGPVELTAGLAAEGVNSPTGLLPPRDSRILTSPATFDDWQLSPKVGATATFRSGTTLRAAVFSRMASPIGRLQTLEPTQVSGFNQFYEDVGGTTSWSYGLGVDQGFGSFIYFGAAWVKRDLSIPEAYCTTPGNFTGCANQAGTVVVDRNSDDDLASAYFNALIGKRVAVSIDWELDEREFDTTTISPTGAFQDRFATQRIRPQVRLFLPIGFFASATAAYYDQEVDQFTSQNATTRTTVTSSFWISSAAIGWRLPRRIGSIALEGTNLADKQFDFYQQSLQENLVPARRVLLRADFAF